MYQTTTSVPTAHITKSRGRLKTYNTNVYLKDGSTFEIELFNPKTVSVLAKIWINDSLISTSGIVLRPGQRAFIERFIDDPKKFVFNTYEVENTSEAKAATKANGKIRVDFYDEDTTPKYNLIQEYNGWPNNGTITYPNPIFPKFPPPGVKYRKSVIGGCGLNDDSMRRVTFGGTGDAPANMFFCNSNLSDSMQNVGATACYTSSTNMKSMPTMDWMAQEQERSATVETGRIEKGAKSNQKFDTINMDFNSWISSTSTWQILPNSAKPVETAEIRDYCTNCGMRQKKQTWKFCPNCGTPANE